MINTITKFILGITLFTYGINNLSYNFKKNFFQKKKNILTGIIITIITQSSSFITVLLVSLVNNNILNFNDTIPIIMGSNIGSAITTWLIPFTNNKITFFNTEIIIAIFSIITIFNLLRKKKSNFLINNILILLGIKTMSESLLPLTNYLSDSFFSKQVINPLSGLLIGFIFTALIQSSTITITFLNSLAISQKLTFLPALTIILGTNIGTCSTVLLSTIKTNQEAKKVSLFHFLFNFLGTIIFLITFYFLNYFFHFSFTYKTIKPWHIPLINSIFNILTTIILYPFNKKIIKISAKLIKKNTEKKYP